MSYPGRTCRSCSSAVDVSSILILGSYDVVTVVTPRDRSGAPGNAATVMQP